MYPVELQRVRKLLAVRTVKRLGPKGNRIRTWEVEDQLQGSLVPIPSTILLLSSASLSLSLSLNFSASFCNNDGHHGRHSRGNIVPGLRR